MTLGNVDNLRKLAHDESLDSPPSFRNADGMLPENKVNIHTENFAVLNTSYMRTGDVVETLIRDNELPSRKLLQDLLRI